jgi:heme-degrading monooxygenase HmoA
MNDEARNFVEVCIYEVKPDRCDDFETLLDRVALHHRDYPGVTEVRYIKRTHRQGDFASVKRGERPIRLTRKPKSVTYVLYWELEDDVAHGKATQSGLGQFYSEFRRCLVKAPRIILGERLV